MTIATTESAAPVAVTGSTGANLIREAAAVMADAHALATAVCNTAMVPKHFQGKPDDTAAAMLYGASLGLDPMQAVRAIYVVHGSPGLYAKSMAGLAAAHGHETWTVATSDESVTVAGRRKGSERVEEATWTIERATKAGYVPTIDPATGKYKVNQYGKLIGNEKYFTDPQAMLHAKAQAEICRKIAPDVLAGVYSVEEIESEQRFTVEQVPTRGLAAVLAPQTSGAGDAPDDLSASVERTDSSAPESEPITSAQLTKIGILCGELGLTDPSEARREVGAVIGREIKSRKDLSKDEAHRVIDRFTSMVEHPFADSEPVDGEVVE